MIAAGSRSRRRGGCTQPHSDCQSGVNFRGLASGAVGGRLAVRLRPLCGSSAQRVLSAINSQSLAGEIGEMNVGNNSGSGR